MLRLYHMRFATFFVFLIIMYIRWKRMCRHAFQCFLKLMNDPILDCSAIETRLRARAATAVEPLSEDSVNRIVPEELDLVFSGGGFKNCYSAGVALALKEIQKRTKNRLGRIKRISGASAGAQVGLGVLNNSFGFMLVWSMAVACTIRRFPVMQPFPMWRYFWHQVAQLSVPNPGVLHVSITQCGIFKGLQNVIVSSFHNAEDLGEALLSSGAIPWFLCEGVGRRFRGKWVIDGGVTNNTPIFTDKIRPQLIVRFSHLPRALKKIIYFSNDEMLKLVEQGIDDLVVFIRDGSAAAPNLTLLGVE